MAPRRRLPSLPMTRCPSARGTHGGEPVPNTLVVAGFRCVAAMFVERGSAPGSERHEHALPITRPLLNASSTTFK